MVVAVCVSVTTRKLRPSRLEQLSLFTIMLPSMLKTLSHINTPPPPATGGRKVEIWVYVGYDAGDPFFDRPGREQEVEGWIQRHLVEPLRAAGTDLQFVLLRFQNHVGKPGAYPSDLTPSHLSPCHPTTNRSSPPHRHPIPGPAFNFLTRAAFDDGAHSRGPNTAVGSARDQCDQCALPRSQPVGLEGALSLDPSRWDWRVPTELDPARRDPTFETNPLLMGTGSQTTGSQTTGSQTHRRMNGG